MPTFLFFGEKRPFYEQRRKEAILRTMNTEIKLLIQDTSEFFKHEVLR